MVLIGCNIWLEKSMNINGKVYNMALEVESNVKTKFSRCCASETNSSIESNLSHDGLDNSSFIFVWNENATLIEQERNIEKEDHMVQSLAVYGNRNYQALSKKLSGNGNVNFFDPCGLKAKEGKPAPKLGKV